jgi:hypothetical protein
MARVIPTIQAELGLSRKADPVDVPTALVLKQSTLAGAVALCVQVSGLDDKEVYLELGIDAGHWSRIMKGDAHFPLNRLNDLCDICGNESPLLWWAHSRGYELKPLEDELHRRLRIEKEAKSHLEAENALLRNLLIGRAA